MRVDRRLLGWGLFFILLGAVPLAVRFNLVDRAVVERWPLLWPLLLIGWGVGLVLTRTAIAWIGGAVVALTFGLMGGGAIATGFGQIGNLSGCGGQGAGTAFATRSGEVTDRSSLDVEFSCGSLTVAPGRAAGWSVSGTDGSGSGPRVETTGDATTIRTPSAGGPFSAARNVWQIALPPTPLALGLTLNAGEGTVDLGGTTLTSLSMTLNAGSLIVDAGAAQGGDINLSVNAGRASLTLPATAAANLSLNAGTLDVCLAAGTPTRVRWSGALGSNDLDAAGLVKVDEATWTTRGFDAAQPHAELRVSANAGSFGLTYGGCGA